MKINEKLLKQLTEVSYLRGINVERYRVLIRYFYLEHEKIHYWLYKEELYQMMIDTGIFDHYTMDDCQNDLKQLTEWGNLTALQDSSKVMSLEEFQNRKFRYQLSDYTIEIERMALKLENLEIEGASLEPSLLERIRLQINKIHQIKDENPMKVGGWWNELNNDFIRLNRNYQDYIKTLNSAKAEELMKTEAFLIYKEKILQYLRSFVKGLQEESLKIEQFIRNVEDQEIEIIFDKVVNYELSIPRIDVVLEENDVRSKCQGRWKSIYTWFMGEEESEVHRMQEITMDIIRRITRAAQQIGELHYLGANRKEEYRHLAMIFAQCTSLQEAHKLSALVFGVETSLHLKDINARETESIDSGVYDESITFYALEARTRIKKEKEKRKPANDYTLERQIQKNIQLQREEDNKRLIMSYIQDGCIDSRNLDKISQNTRKILLGWISRALSNHDQQSKNEWGMKYRVVMDKERSFVLHCEDGDLTMPEFKIVFLKESL